MVTNYLCLKEDAHMDVVSVSKGSNTTVLENVHNGLSMVAFSSKRSRDFISIRK